MQLGANMLTDPLPLVKGKYNFLGQSQLVVPKSRCIWWRLWVSNPSFFSLKSPNLRKFCTNLARSEVLTFKLRPHTTDCWSGPDTFLIPVSESPNFLSLPQSLLPFLTNKEVSWIWYKVWSDQYHAACGRSFTAPKKYFKTHWKLANKAKALKIIFRNDDHALSIKELRAYLSLPTAAYLCV